MIKSVWCRSLRYFFHVLLEKIPHPSATELLHSVVAADHTQSFCQGTKWLICSVVFNWQVGPLLWFFLVLLSQHNFSGWVGFFCLFAVELLWFQVARRTRMTEKAIRVSLKNLPNKNFRKIIVSKVTYRLKSLFHLVPVPFWEWPQQQVPPEASFGGCSDSDEPVHCRGTSLCIPHLWEITFCHESGFSCCWSFLTLCCSARALNFPFCKRLIVKVQAESKCLQNSGFSSDLRLTDVSFTGYKYSSKSSFAFLVTSHWPSQCR